MARPLRIERAGGWYHVGSRGIERRSIYRDDRDRTHWLEILGQTREMFGLRIHGYVMMGNHFHGLLETPEANLSRAMHWLNTSYTVWFNKRHQRVGPLFQGRYKAIVVEPEVWGLELSRYIHLNPVRVERFRLGKGRRKADRLGAGPKPTQDEVRQRIKYLRDYRWSSYRSFIGLEKAPPWLETRQVLAWGGPSGKKSQRQCYREYVEGAARQGLMESPWEQLISGLALGSREWLEQVKASWDGGRREQPQSKGLELRPSLERVIKAVEEIKQEAWESFRDRHGDWGRDMVLYLARGQGGVSLSELGAAAGGTDYAAISVAIKRFGGKLERDKDLAREMKKVMQMLNVDCT